MIDSPIKRIMLKIVLIMLLVLVIGYVGWRIVSSPKHFVDDVLVVSDRPLIYASKDQIQASIEPLVDGSWLQTSAEKAYQAIATYPGIENVWVKKAWPNHLAIYFTQAQPVAYWNDPRQVLLEDGHIILPRTFLVDQRLPQFDGARSQRDLIKSTYLELSPICAKYRLSIDRISYLDGQWSLKLSNGENLMLGSEALKIRLLRYLEVMSELPLPEHTEYVDLRYNTGLAVMPIKSK